MSQRDSYPAGVPCWVDTLKADPERSAEFYAALMGWTITGPGPMPDGGRYYVAQLHGHDVAGVGSAPPHGVPPAWDTYVAVEDVATACGQATEAGATVLVGPVSAAPAGELAVIADPHGAALGLWRPGTRQGAQRVNEPGAWAMSTLHTPDPAAAARFYAAAFGWESEPFGTLHLFRQPGYVGGEAEQPVPRDVVAVMSPTDGPAHWGVVFWTQDVDAAAARATELGGSVPVAPHATPGFRQAVLADPEGAVFSLSQLLA